MDWIAHAPLATEPLISVVLPTRDRQPLLQRAIGSVLAQCYPNWELLVADDGSQFQQPARHRKWKEANINSSLRGWKRFPAAEEWLARNAEQQRTSAIQIDPSLVRAQAAKAAPNDPAAQERLYREFMEWAKTQINR